MSQNIVVNFGAPGPTLQKFAESKARVRILIGPLGSGKTWQVCQEVLKMAATVPPWDNGVRRCKIAAIRNTYKELTSTTIPEWQEKFGSFATFTAGSIDYPKSKIDVALSDGTRLALEVLFISMDGTRSEVEKKFRGLPLTFAWFNETKELPKAGIDMAMGRLGRYPPKKQCPNAPWGAVGDSNAPDQDHWLYHMATSERPPDWAIFKQPGAVLRNGVNSYGRVNWVINPDAENAQNLPDGYYQFNQQGKSDDWIAVNLANEYGYVMDGRPVYPEFAEHMHVVEQLAYIPTQPLIVGVDFGFTPAAAFIQITPSGNVHVIDELVSEYMGIHDFGKLLGQHIRAHYPQAQVDGWGDPSGNIGEKLNERTAFKMINEGSGIYFRPTNTNNPNLRREAVSSMLTGIRDKRPAFAISQEKCPMLIKGFSGGYHFKRVQVVGDEKFKDEPNKNIYSHVHDALQYACLGAGLGRQLINSNPMLQNPVIRPNLVRNAFNIGQKSYNNKRF